MTPYTRKIESLLQQGYKVDSAVIDVILINLNTRVFSLVNLVQSKVCTNLNPVLPTHFFQCFLAISASETNLLLRAQATNQKVNA